MFTNKSVNGNNNICGPQIYKKRKELGISQRKLADMLQLENLNIDKNAIQRIEAGKRFVTDIELITISKVLSISLENLLNIT